MTTASTASPDTVAPQPVPYPAAGLSRILAWIDRLPQHGWWVHPLLYVVQVAWGHGVVWATGVLPLGTFEPLILVGSVYGPYALAILGWLTHVANRSLAAFWPATGWPAVEQAIWRYRFTTSPGGFGLLSLGAGVLFAVGAIVPAPAAGLGSLAGDRVIALIAMGPLSVFGYGTFIGAVINSVHLLRQVDRIHREAGAIDPFDRVPVYAFSRLTALAGLAYVVSGYYTLTVNGAFQAGNLLSLVALSGTFAAGIASFILPLWGIHGRLEAEKERLLRDVDARAAAVSAELYRRIDAGEFESTKAVADGYAGVSATRHRIEQLPTWPWPPQLLRGFVSALLLPVAVYLLTRVAGSALGG